MQDHDDAVAISLQTFKQYEVHPNQQRLLDKLTTFAADVVFQSICRSVVIRAGPVCGSHVTTVNVRNQQTATVDMLLWECNCRTFSAYQLPCAHIIAAAVRMCYRMG